MDSKDRDLQFMRTSSEWPAWPFLPVKNRTKKDKSGLATLGVMIDTSLQGVVPPDVVSIATVYEGNVWQLAEDAKQGKFNPKPMFEYKSLEELVADGWVVD